MELEPEIFSPKVNNLIMDYCKHMKSSEEYCLICLEIKKDWAKYQLKCGHQFHTRCLRKWLATKDRLNCSVCGDLAESVDNTYCHLCDDFVKHSWDECYKLYYYS